MAMSPAQSELWSKIEQFPIDDPASDFSFSDRLARENGWSKLKTASVIKEYLKFVFLACEAGHPITPSLDVDEAWHLHMIYTRSYWTDLCQNTIERPLHHGPTKGGSSESSKFHKWYQNTLDSYSRLFDKLPPAEIWPAAKQRFSNQNNPVRINKATHWVIPKPHKRFLSDRISSSLKKQWANTKKVVAGIVAGLLAITLVGCNDKEFQHQLIDEIQSHNPLPRINGPTFLVLFLLLLISLNFFRNRIQRRLLHQEMVEDVSKYKSESPEMIALMLQHSGQKYRLLQMTLARLMAENTIQYDKKDKLYRFSEPFIKPLNPFDAAVCQIIAKTNFNAKLQTSELLSIELAACPLVRSLETEIESRRLFEEPEKLFTAQIVGFLCQAVFCTIGIARVIIGIDRDKSVGLVFFELIIGFVWGFFWYSRSTLMAKYARGSKVLDFLRKEIVKPKPLSDRELEFLLVRVKIEFRPKSFDHSLWILIDSINEFFASIKQATHRCITT